MADHLARGICEIYSHQRAVQHMHERLTNFLAVRRDRLVCRCVYGANVLRKVREQNTNERERETEYLIRARYAGEKRNEKRHNHTRSVNNDKKERLNDDNECERRIDLSRTRRRERAREHRR